MKRLTRMKKRGRQGGKAPVRALGIFFAVMAVCTVLSRAASSILTAQVEAGHPTGGNITDTYAGKGEVVPSEKSQIFLWPDQQVEKSAAVGDEVKKGECLVQFRLEYLEQKIQEKEAEISQLNLQLQQQEIAAKGTSYASSASSALRTLENARAQLQNASRRAEEAQAAYDGFPGESEEEKQALYEALTSALNEKSAAEQSVTEAENAYADAQAQDAVQEENNASAAETARLSAQQIQVQINEAQKKLDTLKGYREAGGKLCASGDCVVLENNVADGTVTSGSELIVTGSGAWRLRGTLGSGENANLPEGTKVTVSLDSDSRSQEISIESVEEKAQTGTAGGAGESGAGEASGSGEGGSETGGDGTSAGKTLFWNAAAPEGMNVGNGDTFTWKASVPSEKSYENKIPLSALREDMTGNYCLVVTEEASVLGTVKKAKRVNVTVLKKNGEEAAVEGELEKTDQVIVSSEKYVEEGDQIRIKDER